MKGNHFCQVTQQFDSSAISNATSLVRRPKKIATNSPPRVSSNSLKFQSKRFSKQSTKINLFYLFCTSLYIEEVFRFALVEIRLKGHPTHERSRKRQREPHSFLYAKEAVSSFHQRLPIYACVHASLRSTPIANATLIILLIFLSLSSPCKLLNAFAPSLSHISNPPFLKNFLSLAVSLAHINYAKLSRHQ